MMNIAFSKYVKMNGRQWEVNFRRKPGADDHFYADTPDLQGERIHFTINKKDSGWEINGQSLPHWFHDAKPKISEAVENGVQEFQAKYADNIFARWN